MPTLSKPRGNREKVQFSDTIKREKKSKKRSIFFNEQRGNKEKIINEPRANREKNKNRSANEAREFYKFNARKTREKIKKVGLILVNSLYLKIGFFQNFLTL